MGVADDKPGKKGFTVNDQRWWLKDDVDLESLDNAPEDKKPSYVEELEEKIRTLEQRIAKTLDAHRVSKEEMQQVRQRLEREQDLKLEVQRAKLAEPFLEVLDNLDRLVSHDDSQTVGGLVEGAQLVLKQLKERLSELGIEPIEARGMPFDPNTMEAMMTAEVPDEDDGKVIEVIRPGYMLGQRVVRPAGVRVGVAKRERS